METINATDLNKLLFDDKSGFLINYHFEKGINLDQLDTLYDILESCKNSWAEKDCVPKDIIFLLITISPSLYMDLPLYLDKKGCENYESILYNLDTAISMCLNPNIDDPHFNTPLKDLNAI